MRRYTASEARDRFAELLQSVEEGDEIAITRHGKPVAKITRVVEAGIPPPGWARKDGWAIEMAEDFNDTPDDFHGYV